VHPLAQFVVNFQQLCLTPFAHRLTEYGKLSFSGFTANMRKTEEIESLRFSPTSLGTILRRKTAEFNQASFPGV